MFSSYLNHELQFLIDHFPNVSPTAKLGLASKEELHLSRTFILFVVILYYHSP